MSRERDIFVEAQEIASPEERARFVEAACDGDPELWERVRGLLEVLKAPPGFLENSAVAPGQKLADLGTGAAEGAGSVVGRYKLLERIGEGGFGVVYMAEQREPVKRKVALKIIKLGMDTRQVVARFEGERQALALMEHPHIARVFDAGATETGRPYFVMELVRGLPITQFCDEHNLTTEERLRLFVQVCAAIQHAHQKGIIHRDIKPSNVMITMHDDRPVPKVIDFGIAKATLTELTDKTIFTRFHEFLGTPAYMSPEQAQLSGLDLDTRTDIYSLGVLLYELLTGRTPFDPKELLSAGYDELRRRIREDEPMRPSTRLSTLAGNDRAEVARRRRADPNAISRLLRDDVDWIVMKALEKDRSRRYESASALAADIQRYLRNEPVTAVAPSLGYQLRKFARRHRTVLASAAALVLGLAAVTVMSGWLAWRATRAEMRATGLLEAEQHARRLLERTLATLHDTRRGEEAMRSRVLEESARADAEAATAEALTRALGEEVDGELQREGTLQSLIAQAKHQLQEHPSSRPQMEAAIRAALGNVYRELGLYPQAEAQLRRACDLFSSSVGARHEQTIRARSDLALTFQSHKDGSNARVAAEQALADARAALGEKHPLTVQCLSRLAALHYWQRRGPEAFRYARQALEAAAGVTGVSDRELFRASHLVAREHAREGRFNEGEKLLREALDRFEERHGSEHALSLRAGATLAAFYYDHGRNLEEAEALYLRTLRAQERRQRDSDELTFVLRNNLILLYESTDRRDAALYQNLKILEAWPLESRALQLLPRLLETSPLRRLGAASDEGSPTWRFASRPPGDEWGQGHFDDSHWGSGLVPGEPLLWARLRLEIPAPVPGPVAVRIYGWGDFDLFFNGVRVPLRFGSTAEGYQFAVCPSESIRDLRAGRNVVGVRGRNLRPGRPVKIELLEYPSPAAAAE